MLILTIGFSTIAQSARPAGAKALTRLFIFSKFGKPLSGHIRAYMNVAILIIGFIEWHNSPNQQKPKCKDF
jgi:hypothetical protein